MIMIEVSPTAYPQWSAGLGEQATNKRGGDRRRFDTNQHPFYGGVDLHARRMYVCIMSHDGEIVLHRHMQAAPAPVLKAIAPYRGGLVVAVECLFTWSWLAALCATEGLAFVLGPALYLNAIHGGKAKHDKIDAHKMAALLRGGMLPQAYVDPAEMRATRDLWRRRTHRMRKRSELLAHVQQTDHQSNRPEIGKTLAYKANRSGVAARFAEPAVQKTIAVALGLITYDDALVTDLELSSVQTAKRHDAHTFYGLRSIPGVGKILALVRLSDMHAIHRVPRVQDCISYCRLVKWARESAGTRYGTSGKKSGNAHLTWAFAEAAVRFLRHNPAGRRHLAGWENKHGKGKARTVLAHKLARAVYDMRKRDTVCEMDRFLHGSGEQSG
jgi:transposase